jgi:3-phosphoshikimate 1-carboxyvinyltransferase
VLTGAEELRVKESDRIQVMADGLAVLGIEVEPRPDGIRVRGAGVGAMLGATRSAIEVDSHGDNRIAMSFAIAALRTLGPVAIRACANVNTSFPGFASLARSAGLAIDEHRL